MGAEGGVAWLTLHKETDRDDVLALLAMVGIEPSTGGRDAINSWLAGHTREDNDDINSSTESCWDVLPNAPSVIDEWNTCLDWMGLLELGDIWYELQSVLKGEDQGLGLGPEATFQDVAMEELTNPWVQSPQPSMWGGRVRREGDPLRTLHEGMEEVWRYKGGWEAAMKDPDNAMTIATWCERLRSMVVLTGKNNDCMPFVNDHEVWT